AGNEVDATGAQTQGLENIETDLDLLDRIGRQRNANGVADALGQQHAQADRGFHRTRTQAASLGDTQVQRLLDLGGEQAIGTDGHKHVGGLDADLEVLEVQLVEMIDMAQRRLQQGFGGWLAVLLLQVLLQRTGVDADADRDAVVTRRVDHRADAILTADVTGVDAQAINAQVSHPQGDLVIEMDVRHQRHVDLLADFAKGFGGLHTRHGYADDVGTDGFQLANLRDRGRHVAGLGIGHALHRNGCIAANQHRAHADLTGLSAYDRGLLMHCVTSYWPSRSRATPELALAWSSTGCPLYSIVATALAAPI